MLKFYIYLAHSCNPNLFLSERDILIFGSTALTDTFLTILLGLRSSYVVLVYDAFELSIGSAAAIQEINGDFVY